MTRFLRGTWAVIQEYRLLPDFAFLVGLALLSWGGWQLSPPLTAIALGVIFVILGMLPYVRGGKGPE